MNIKKIIMEVIIVMGIMSLLTSCAKSFGEKGDGGIGKRAKDNESGIASMTYSYNGTIGANSYSYKIEENDGKVLFTYEAMQHREFGEMVLECEPEILDRLYDLYKEKRIAEWDGFAKYNPNVLDGDGFSISINFKDGASLSAHGSNAYPERFWEAESDIETILGPLSEKILTQKRQELIAGGIQGELSSVMVHFIQHGNSGKDEYSFFIIDDKYREDNCDILIKSVSEEYFPKGENKYHLNIPYSEIDFSPVRKLIDDYNIIEWYDYYETADDYDNAEWFQIEFGFGDEMHISACGTEHPENYDEFRNGFLLWMKDVVEKFVKASNNE